MVAFTPFNRVEDRRIQDGRDHCLVRKHRDNLSLRFLGNGSFCFVGDKNRRQVTVAFITELPPIIEGVDIHPVMIKQLLIAHLVRIVGYFDRFVVPFMVAVIGWIFLGAAGKSGDNVGDAFKFFEI